MLGPEVSPKESDRDRRRVLVSVNPMAGARSAESEVERLVGLLAARGFQTDVLTDLGQVSRRANELHANGQLQTLVSVGGDGTVAELVNRTEPGVPITILPTGNENLLARHVGLRRSAEALADVIAGGRRLRLDAGRAGGRLFLVMISCGFDAEVVRRFQERRTGHIGSHSYVRPIVQAIGHYEYSRMLIYCDDPGRPARSGQSELTAPHEACWFFAFNLPCYATGLGFAPGADGTDGLLDVCTFRRGSTWNGLRYLAAVVLRRHERMADCRMFRTPRLRIEADGDVPYQLDGDFAGYLPVEVEVVPGRLTLLIPPDNRVKP